MRLRNKETGETGYLELEKGDDEKYTGLRVYKNDFMYKRYDSLAGVLEEWEDYKPAEPLIKDDKIRKAVRAWAEANDIDADEHLYVTSPTFDNKFLTIEKGGLVLSSYYDDESIKDGSYTITELCGEEAPEPLELSFIDLDERIREKEEE